MAGTGAFKDVVLAIVIVGAVLGGLFLFTGVWPPMVVVESGSMMHANACPPPPGQPDLCDPAVGYGKLGFIDPGDMVFVKRAPKREDVTAMADAAARNPGERNYGKPGDVVVYFNFENVPRDEAARAEAKKVRTPIIHRAIAYVEVNGVQDRDACRRGSVPAGVSYSVFWDGKQNNFGSAGIYLPTMGFGGSSGSYTPDRGYKPCWSGFITKGDNPVTNVFPDQALGGGTLPQMPIEVDWIEGKAIGELPWFGLIKLALSSQANYQCTSLGGTQLWRANDPACDNGRAVKVLSAYAPADLWVMLGVSLAVIAIAPLGYDMYVIRRNQDRAAAESRGERPPPGPFDDLKRKLQGLTGRDDPPPPGEEGTADPRSAFEPPAEPPQERQQERAAPPPPPPASPPPKPGSGTKFERVKK